MKTKILLLFVLFLIPVAQLSAQKPNKKIQISGSVTDKNKMPVGGVSILVDNKSTGKVTNNKGFYKIKVSREARIISAVSFSGSVIESAINNQTEINFSLPIDIMADSEKPVNMKGEEEINVGYGTVKKKNLNTSVNKIDATENRYAAYRNVYEMLRGQPGVQVNGTSITIQGASSIMLSTEPLFVVDGAIVTSIDDIQPLQVKSIEILKGSSASIYGARGANGVILITMRK